MASDAGEEVGFVAAVVGRLSRAVVVQVGGIDDGGAAQDGVVANSDHGSREVGNGEVAEGDGGPIGGEVV